MAECQRAGPLSRSGRARHTGAPHDLLVGEVWDGPVYLAGLAREPHAVNPKIARGVAGLHLERNSAFNSDAISVKGDRSDHGSEEFAPLFVRKVREVLCGFRTI